MQDGACCPSELRSASTANTDWNAALRPRVYCSTSGRARFIRPSHDCIKRDGKRKQQMNLLSNVYESKDRVCAADKDGASVDVAPSQSPGCLTSSAVGLDVSPTVCIIAASPRSTSPAAEKLQWPGLATVVPKITKYIQAGLCCSQPPGGASEGDTFVRYLFFFWKCMFSVKS